MIASAHKKRLPAANRKTSDIWCISMSVLFYSENYVLSSKTPLE